MAKINGDHIAVTVDGTPIAHSTSASLNISENLLDAASKDSERWKDNIKGDREWSIEVEGLTDYSATFGVEGLLDLILDGNTAEVVFTVYENGSESSGFELSGTVDLSDLTIDGPHNDNSTFSGTLQGNGKPSKSTV